MPPKIPPRPPSKGATPRGPSPRAPSPAAGAAAAAAPPPADVPPPPPPPPPEPPSEKEVQKSLLKELMSKKMVEWDRMMDATKDDDRKKGLEAFRHLSEEELSMATRHLSKNKLKEYIDLKNLYFDKLANATSRDGRLEGMRQFKKVCDDELNLARSLGPTDPLEELNKEPPLKPGDESGEKSGKSKEGDTKDKTPADTGLMPLPTPMPTPAPAPSGAPPPPALPPGIQQLLPSRMMPPPPAAPGFGAVPTVLPMGVNQHLIQPPQGALQAWTSAGGVRLRPLVFSTGIARMPAIPIEPRLLQQFPPEDDLVGMAGQSQRADDIDDMLKLLNQLESAREVLQNQPAGSTSSLAEEIKYRLRKINRLQMQVVDDILGGRADVTSDIVSDLEPPPVRKKDRRKGRASRRDDKERKEYKKGKKGTRSRKSKEDREDSDEERKSKKRDDSRESRKDDERESQKTPKERRIIVELPAVLNTVTAVPARSEEKFAGDVLFPPLICTGNTEYCRLDREDTSSRPDVIWERPSSRSKRMLIPEPENEDVLPERGYSSVSRTPSSYRTERYDRRPKREPPEAYQDSLRYDSPPRRGASSMYYPPSMFPPPPYPMMPPAFMPPSSNLHMPSPNSISVPPPNSAVMAPAGVTFSRNIQADMGADQSQDDETVVSGSIVTKTSFYMEEEPVNRGAPPTYSYDIQHM